MGLNLRRGLLKERKKEAKLEAKVKAEKEPYNLDNSTVCITGTISGFTRTQAKNRLKTKFKNIKFKDAVSGMVDTLITGYGTGQTKLTKAKRLGVRILDWNTLWENC